MPEQARDSARRFDVICVHSFSRFYRNGMEMTIRQLRNCGVEVVSVTQPTGDDPSQQLMRQIIGIFDVKYFAREECHPRRARVGQTRILERRDAAAGLFASSRRSAAGIASPETERDIAQVSLDQIAIQIKSRVVANGRVTKRAVNALVCPSGKDRVFLWDDALVGFGVAAFPTGRKAHVTQYRAGGALPTLQYRREWSVDARRSSVTGQGGTGRG
jgi:hypothetical protein